MEGRTVSFSEADVAATAAAYDPARHQAPLVIGHPTRDDAPAFGWVGSLAADGATLRASFSEISPAARELVEAGHYRHVSASFYAPGASANPTPGIWALRHVGLLGAVPPAVKGLGAVSFAGGDAEDVVTVSFGELDHDTAWSLAGLARLLGRFLRRSREAVIARDGVEAADSALPSWEVDEAEAVAQRLIRAADAPSDPVLGFAQPEPESKPETLSMTEDEIADLKAERDRLAAANASFAEQARKAEADADRAFLDGLVAKGVLPPGDLAGVASFVEALDATATVSFGEGTDKASPRAWFKEWLAKRPPAISFGEVSGASGEVSVPDDAMGIAKAIEASIAAAAAKGQVLSYAEAAQPFLDAQTR